MRYDLMNSSSDKVEAAYQALSDDDKIEIDMMAIKLEKKVKARHYGRTPLMFGRKQALELLAKLGILLNKSVVYNARYL